MENRVHYGEYSLEHWVKLILKGNIKLPKYQRSFVWDEDKIKTLIETLKNKQFVPPVTIGAFKVNDINENYILDGQQRLTSILLTYLGVFPNKDKFKEQNHTNYADENDDENDDENNDRMEWTFEKLLDLGKNKEIILSKIDSNAEKLYSKILTEVDELFFKNNFVGFAYIIPKVTDKKEQQKFYSSVFRNINIQGQTLSVQESRKSLYFLDETYSEFFETEAVKGLKVKQPTQPKDVDFIKYLALLSQYMKDGRGSRLAFGYSGTKKSYGTMEKYYEEYLYSVVGERESILFEDFKNIFPDGDYHFRFNNLKKTIDSLFDTKEFTSIIDLDIYLFGLIYKIVFENKEIDLTKKPLLLKELTAKINRLKKDKSHTKTPSGLKHLRNRVSESIKIYNKYEARQPQ